MWKDNKTRSWRMNDILHLPVGTSLQLSEEGARRACSADVASSGDLSSRTLTRRGKRMEMPLSGSARPSAALWRGEMLKSAHFTSHTVLASNHTSGSSVSENLPCTAGQKVVSQSKCNEALHSINLQSMSNTCTAVCPSTRQPIHEEPLHLLHLEAVNKTMLQQRQLQPTPRQSGAWRLHWRVQRQVLDDQPFCSFSVSGPMGCI